MKRNVSYKDEKTPYRTTVKRRKVSLRHDDVAAADARVSNGLLQEELISQTRGKAQEFLDGIDIPSFSTHSIPEQRVSQLQAPIAVGKMSNMGSHRLQGSEVNRLPTEDKEKPRSNRPHDEIDTSQKKKKTKPPLSSVSGAADTATNLSIQVTNREEVVLEGKKSTHKRFGSEEPLVASSSPFLQDAQTRPLDTHVQQPDSLEEMSDSDDDVPETVTASAGLDQARIAAAEQTKAAERQSLAQKEKRQKHDAHLKAQAATAKKNRKGHTKNDAAAQLPIEDQEPKSAARKSQAKPQARDGFKSDISLPALLPAEILAADMVFRPPTPPPLVMTAISKKHKFIDADPKPLKDIKKGAVKVRVLEDNRSILPPRASKASRSLKESWLTGQRGRKNTLSKWRKSGGSFLRK